jgi:hypothetical protein
MIKPIIRPMVILVLAEKRRRILALIGLLAILLRKQKRCGVVYK